MPVMPFEGLHTESYEDAFGTDAYREPTHSDEDEAYYVNEILPGWHDEAEADHGSWAEDTYSADYPDDREADYAADRWERAFWGD